MLAIAHEAGYTIPDELRGRIQGGLRRFVEGRLSRPAPLPSADLTLRKLAALEALSRYGAANAALVGTIVVEPNLWPTSGVLDWWNVVRRVPGVTAREARARDAEAILRARLSASGTTLTFSTEASDRLWCDGVGRLQRRATILPLLEPQAAATRCTRCGGALSRQKFVVGSHAGEPWCGVGARNSRALRVGAGPGSFSSGARQRIEQLVVGEAGRRRRLMAWPARRDDVRVISRGRAAWGLSLRAPPSLTETARAGYP